MTHVADETKINKFFRFLHGVSERALKGSLDVEQFTAVAQVLLDKGARAKNLVDYVAKGCPKVDYTLPTPKAKVLRQQSASMIDLDAEPFIPEGWTVPKGFHQKGGQFAFDPAQMKLYIDAGQQNGKSIPGTQLHQKLADVPVMNANMLDWYLANRQHIPEEWKGKHIFFWGTIYRNCYGRCVRYLSWRSGWWGWGGLWFGTGWVANYPALVRTSTQR